MSSRENNPIIVEKRLGTQNDPYRKISESHVVSSAKVVLSELPFEPDRVKVTGQNKQWYEIQKGLPKEDEYIVDYRNKLVTFNISNNGKQLLFEYKGTGVLYYPTSMIYTKFSDGEITQTLDELTDDMYTDKQAILKAIEDAKAATNNIDVQTSYAKQQGDYAKGQGDSAKTEAANLNTLKTNVTTATTNANNAVTTINGKITEANTAVTNANNALNNFGHVGDYSSSTRYYPRNVVNYNGSSYMNIVESIGVLPTDTSKWKPVASKGDQGVKGEIGSINDAWQGAYNATKAYAKGHLASYNGRVYITKLASTGNLPTNTTYWDIFSDKGSDGAGSVNSVNGKTGNVTIDAQEVGAIPENQKGVANGVAKLDASGNVVDANGNKVKGAITSVNGQTGVVTIPVATTSAEGLLSSSDKTKLNGIATGANNYTHPSTHPASIIDQDASNRFVTDAEKSAWNSSESNAKNYADSLVANASSNFNRSLYKEVANLQLQSEASKRVTNGATFGLTFDTSFGMTIDTFRAKSANALAIGATTITLDSVVGLSVGKEVTIFDDVNLERRTAEAINGNVITVAALTKSFKAQVNVARSMHILDMVNQAFAFSGWEWALPKSQSEKPIVASSYQTSLKARPVRLTNGWFVHAFYYANAIYFYVSKDDGATWSSITYFSNANITSANFSLACKGTSVYCLTGISTTSVIFFSFDATTISGSILSSYNVDTGQTAIGSVDLVIDPKTGTVHATWSSKNSAYPNALNVRYSKSVTNGTTWGTVKQVTTRGTISNENQVNPVLAIKPDGEAVVIYALTNTLTTGAYPSIYAVLMNNEKFRTVFQETDFYNQDNPTACVDKDGVIHVSWTGADAMETTIRYSKSADGGTSWSPVQKLTAGMIYNFDNPSIAVNKKNEVFVAFKSSTSSQGLNLMKYSQGTWGVRQVLSTSAANTYPTTLLDSNLDFAIPILVFKGATNNLFHGQWNEDRSNPILENDIRFTTSDTNEVVTWIQRDEGLTVDATLNGQTMTKTPTSTTEDRFLGTLATKGASDVNLRLKRTSTSDDKKVYKILGGIG